MGFHLDSLGLLLHIAQHGNYLLDIDTKELHANNGNDGPHHFPSLFRSIIVLSFPRAEGDRLRSFFVQAVQKSP
jgi:hypothetical protein